MNQLLEELESLLFDWEDKTLDDQGVQRVREILRSSEEAQEFYANWQVFQSALKLHADSGFTQLEVEKAALPRPRTNINQGRSQIAAPWMVAATLVVCVLVGRVIFLEYANAVHSTNATVKNGSGSIPPHSDLKEEISQGVAILTRLVDVEWTEEQASLEVGDALQPGLLSIQSGFAQVEFFCGATVVIEGPAELVLKTSELAQVRNGRLRAQVPPAARGFSLEVDDMKVVDLGTEFGLSVTEEGSDVQVFDGEVELHLPQAEKQSLTTGQAMRRSGNGKLQALNVTPNQFVDISTLETRDQGQRSHRYQRWQNWTEQLRQDSRLVAYYGFENDDLAERKLHNLTEPANTELDGAIVGATQVPGRWESKSALEFKRPGDRVRLQIPGEYSSLTLACWVKIDSLDRLFNSLFLTDNYNQGEPHWQILHTGQIYFSVRPTEPGTVGPPDQKVLSPSFWKPSMSGKWLHLATTYNAETGLVVHYLNGKPIHQENIPAEQIVKQTRIGIASIGNWDSPTLPDAEFAIRNLNGSIDEFALFAAALKPNEIQEMYLNGKP